MARIHALLQKSEQEQAQRHEHEEEEPCLMQGPLYLHMPPSLPGVHQMVSAQVVHARRLRLPTEHQREDGHRHPSEHPSGRRVHHAAVPERRGEEGVELRGVGVGGVPRRPGWRVDLGVPMVVPTVAAAVLRALSQGRGRGMLARPRGGFLASELPPRP